MVLLIGEENGLENRIKVYDVFVFVSIYTKYSEIKIPLNDFFPVRLVISLYIDRIEFLISWVIFIRKAITRKSIFQNK